MSISFILLWNAWINFSWNQSVSIKIRHSCLQSKTVSRTNIRIMENSEYAGWYPIDFLAWIHQDPKIRIFILAGKLIRILTYPLFP